MHTMAQPWMWLVFLLFVLLMLVVDMVACGGNQAQKMTIRQATVWSLVWVMLALLFAALLFGYVYHYQDSSRAQTTALEFLTGYVLEKSLSIDNIFVFLLIFNHFSVPAEYQRKVLLLGVLGAIVLRIAMILAGVWLVEEFSWILYVFGIFLILTGVKMMLAKESESNLDTNLALRTIKKLLPFSNSFNGEHFTVIEHGRKVFTPLFLVLIMIEMSDVLFAVDSIPAIFAVTTDPFIVFTSNIFAIMGLRALYFLLADMAERFHYLNYGLALVLIFVGGKMLIADWWHMPTLGSLAVIGVIVVGSVVLSLMRKAQK